VKSGCSGMVFWLTGLAGAGKSTLAAETTTLLKERGRQAILLDGDELRKLFVTGESTFSLEERRTLAGQYAHLCHLLSEQGVDVVCATISLFPEVQAWAKDRISGFRLVYIRVDMDVLHQRDQKGLYSRAARGEVTNVMGVDLPYDEPHAPDLILDNNGDRSPRQLAAQIVDGVD